MPGRLVVLDTTVLCNVLELRGNQKDFDADRKIFNNYYKTRVQMVLPLATIIETGNFVVQSTGNRFQAIERFIRLLSASVEGKAPWVASDQGTTSALIERMLTATPNSLKQHLVTGIGTGDASILVEIARLRRDLDKSITVELWTHDLQLASYANH